MSNKIEGLCWDNHEITQVEAERLGKILLELSGKDLGDMLPPEEAEAYKEAQQSVVDARAAAPQSEGNIVII